MQPLTLEYEEVVHDPQGAVDRIAALTGVVRPAPIGRVSVTFVIQRDATNAEWRQQFLLDTGGEFRQGTVRRFRPLRGARKLFKSMRRRLAARRGRPPADRGYLICSSPRCGSTYFCELLASTGLLGVPREYMNVGGRWGKLDRERPTDLRALLDRVLRAGATPNGIYALKVHADHFAAIAAVIDPLRALPNLRLVRIRRRDILAQAISWSRARQTRQFLATDIQKHVPTYDAAGIRKLLELLIEQEATWERLLAVTGGTPIEVEYESLVRNPQRDVDRVAQFMGLALPVPIAPQRVKITIQRDDLNADWRSRFLAETGEEFGHLATIATPPSTPGSASAS